MQVKERITIRANETDRLDTPTLQDDSTDARKAVQKKLDRVADQAAMRVGNREQQFDVEHGIFTK